MFRQIVSALVLVAATVAAYSNSFRGALVFDDLPAMFAVGLWALLRRKALGFLVFAFFVILSPSSSIVPIATQATAEHRMYLPLASVTVGTAAALYLLGQRVLVRRPLSVLANRDFHCAYLAVVVAVATLFGWKTWQRNVDYHSEASIWADTVAKAPRNPRAWVGLSRATYNQGDHQRALEQLDRAVEIDPEYAEAFFNRAVARESLGMFRDALDDISRAIELRPNAVHYCVRASIWGQLRQPQRALADFDAALRCDPTFAAAYFNRANLYRDFRDTARALADFSRAIEADAGFAPAYWNRAALLAQSGNFVGAISDCSRAIELSPNQPELYRNRAAFYSLAGRNDLARRDLAVYRQMGGVPEGELVRMLGEGP